MIVAFGSPAKFVKYAIRQLRAAGHQIGYVRPITLWPFPYDDGRRRGRAARTCGASAASSSRAGQMIDDVRIGVAGRAPVEFIGGVSTDDSGFGVGPASSTSRSIAERLLALHEDREHAADPRLRRQQLRSCSPTKRRQPDDHH